MSPVTTLRGPVKLYVLYTPGDRRRRDVPGMLDAILHLLEKAEVVEDDAQIVDVSWHTEPMNSCHPGALVSVTRLT
jgi:Holliday junction resolvase RusA-like endonuclease